jgi:hypothetical protein
MKLSTLRKAHYARRKAHPQYRAAERHAPMRPRPKDGPPVKRPTLNPAAILWPERNDVPPEPTTLSYKPGMRWHSPRSQETPKARRWRKDSEQPITILNDGTCIDNE